MKFAGLQYQIRSNKRKSIFLVTVFPIVATLTLMFVMYLYCVSSHHHEALEISPLTGIASPVHDANTDCMVFTLSSSELFFKLFPWVVAYSALWYILIIPFWDSLIDGIYFENHDGHYGSSLCLEYEEMKKGATLKKLQALATAAGVPTPRLRVIDSRAQSAFAAGFSRKTYSIYVTQGMINTLSARQMKAVLAHELAHIINRDTLFLMIGIIFSGFFTLIIYTLAAISGLTVLFGKGGGGLAAIFGTIIFSLILAPGLLIIILTKCLISRKREYLADATAVEITADPVSLIQALRKLENAPALETHLGASAFMIVAPPKKQFFGRLFSSHPSVDSRVRFLEDIACRLENANPPVCVKPD